MRLAFGVIVLKQILPFKLGPYAQALDLRLSDLWRHVVFSRVEGTRESGQGCRLILGTRYLGSVTLLLTFCGPSGELWPFPEYVPSKCDSLDKDALEL